MEEVHLDVQYVLFLALLTPFFIALLTLMYARNYCSSLHLVSNYSSSLHLVSFHVVACKGFFNHQHQLGSIDITYIHDIDYRWHF